MNFRKVIQFFQTPAGLSVAGIVCILIGCGVIFYIREEADEAKAVKKQKELVPLAEIKPDPETRVTYTAKLPFTASADSRVTDTRRL
ncbi:MAG: hypothetical protein RL693_156, partial [Verrucomicrobiota bacterium]